MHMMRFIHLSDLHFRKKYSENGFETLIAAKQHPKDNFYKCMDNEIVKNLDFVLVTGDLTHEGEEEDYRELRKIFDEEMGDIPLIVLPGNHDQREAFCCGFLEKGTQEKLDSVHKIRGLRIITMDTGKTENGIITKKQIKWLKDTLSEPSSMGSILALHHPLIANQDGFPCAEYCRELYEVIAQSDIIGIFCGHTHHNYISQFASKPYFTADSMAFSISLKNDNLYFENHSAYTIMQLHNGILSAQIKQVVPAPTIIASFSPDRLSQILMNEKEKIHKKEFLYANNIKTT